MVSFRARAILPSVPTNPALLATLLDAGNRRIADQIKRDFERTTRTWTKKVTFFVTKKKSGAEIVWFAGTENKVYGYVSLGTIPHTIRAKNAPYLRFQTGYKAKTTPNVLGSGQGGASGAWVQTVEVHHPGTDARNFHVIIADRFRDKVVLEANRALREYLAKATKPQIRG